MDTNGARREAGARRGRTGSVSGGGGHASKLFWTVAVLLLLLTTGLRIYRVGAKSLWIDEINQLQISRLPFWEIPGEVVHHYSPPLDYMVEHFSARLVSADAAARIHSVVFGSLAGVLILALGVRWFDRGTTLLSLAMLAVNPSLVQNAQEGRMYSLAVCCVLFSTICFLLVLEKPSLRRWLLYGFSVTVSGYTHYFCLLVFPAHVVIIVWEAVRTRRGKGDLRRWLWGAALAYGGAFLLFLPWLSAVMTQVSRTGGQGIFYALPPAFGSLWRALSYFFYQERGGGLFPILFFLVFAGIGIPPFRRRAGRVTAVVGGAAAVIILGGVFSGFLIRVATARNLMIGLPLLMVLAARGMVVASLTLQRWFLLSGAWSARFLALGIFLCTHAIWVVPKTVQLLGSDQHLSSFKGDWRGLADFLRAGLQPGDRVFLLGDSPEDESWIRTCLEYYLPRVASAQWEEDPEALRRKLMEPDRSWVVYRFRADIMRWEPLLREFPYRREEMFLDTKLVLVAR
jgi:4-amino-4-deoxy-L-arabinose transferase-like glycosyltransferase